MKKYALLMFVLSIFIISPSLFSQSFSVAEIDSKEFPRVFTSFVALDAEGNSYKNIQISDFDVIENNQNLNSSIFIECQDTVIDPAVSVSLVIDQSNSMNTPPDEPISQWVKEGAISFINTLKFVTGTSVEIVTFNQTARVLIPFTNNRTELINAINGMQFAGSTNYGPPLIDDDNGAINRLKNNTPTNIRRIIVFLTDGDPDAQYSTPVPQIIQEAQTANVQIYSITVKMPMNNDLATISANTGGKSYSVFTKEYLNNIYNMIAIDIQTKQLCTIFWNAPFGCYESDRHRKVTIRFKRINREVNTTYTAPANSIAKINTNVSIQYFGDPEPNQPEERVISITPENVDYNVTGSLIDPNDYFQVVDWDADGNLGGPPFIIQKGQTRNIKVRFTQGSAKAYRKATMKLSGSPCPPEVTLVGGVSQVNIISPNGGEIYSSCDEIDIQWAGVTETTPVTLKYRISDTSPWILIKANVTGLSYKWKPTVASDQYEVQVSIPKKDDYMWLTSAGGVNDDEVIGIGLHPNQTFMYIAGYFNDEIRLGTIDLKAKKLKDSYIACYRDDGEIKWANRSGSNENDETHALCVDENGNAYTTGFCYQGSDFGSMIPMMDIPSKQYCFVAKYNFENSATLAKVLGPTTMYSGFTAVGEKIKYDAGRIYIQGNYTGEIQVGTYRLSRSNTRFTAIYDTNLVLILLKEDWSDYVPTTPKSVIDDQGNRFETGPYIGTKTLNTLSVKSVGGKDIYLYKYGGTPGSDDISDNTFKVQKIELTFVQSNLNIGDCDVNSSTSKVFSTQLCNDGELPAIITNSSLSNSTEFSLVSNLDNRTIMPGECLDIEFSFSPKNMGQINSIFTLNGVCMQPITLNVYGNGVCITEAIDEYDMGMVNLGKYKDENITCVFTNLNPFDIEINPVLKNTFNDNFIINDLPGIKLVPAGACYQLSLKYTPQVQGEETALIDFQAQTGCYNQTTSVKGTGVNADLLVFPIDWDLRRIKTVNDSTLVIYNNSGFVANIESIYFENQTSADDSKFTMEIPSLPYTLDDGDSLKIPVSFIPNDEIKYSEKVFIKILGKDTPFTTSLSGEGFLPKISYTWECPDPIKPGQTAMGVLTINSTDSKSPLYIHQISIETLGADYDYENGIQPKDITIPILGNQSFNIEFSPQSTGFRPNAIIIQSDAASGPETLPKTDSRVDISCEGLGLKYTQSVDFKGNIICTELELPIEIINNSSTSNLILSDYSFGGTDASAFEMQFENTTILPGMNAILYIKFSPSEVKDYSAVLNIANSIDEPISINLAGSGKRIYFYSETKDLQVEPKKEYQVDVFADIPDLHNDNITELEVDVKHYQKMLDFVESSIVTQISNWTWTPIKSSNLINVKGSGSLPVPFKGKVFSLSFKAFLPDTLASSIYLKPILGDCPTSDSLILKAHIESVCTDEGRIVELSTFNTKINSVSPNPGNGVININFDMGLTATAKISIFNLLGEEISEIYSERIKAGNYKASFDASKLNSGLYFIRLSAGEYNGTMQFIIDN